ncbi:thiamine pyrophosphate-dependent enzyme, partial [Acinetobacter baumannii]
MDRRASGQRARGGAAPGRPPPGGRRPGGRRGAGAGGGARPAARAGRRRPVVLVTGDMALGLNFFELETAVRHGIKLVVILLN